MTQGVSGLHHVTAIASDPQRNLDFYTRVLGLRLVKRTVNFDAPDTYHFTTAITQEALAACSPFSHSRTPRRAAQGLAWSRRPLLPSRRPPSTPGYPALPARDATS